MRVAGAFRVLSERAFRLVWLARTTSAIGDAIVPVATSFAVLDLAGATQLGIVTACYFGTRMVGVVAGGVWADRLPRQLVMIAADAVRAATQTSIAVAFFAGWVEWWHLAISSAVFGVAAAFFGPASTGLVPQLVPAERLQEANALLSLSRSATDVFGPALSGVLVAVSGFGVVFAIDAASFVASGVFLLGTRLPRAVPTGERQSFLAEAREGLDEVRKRSWLWVAFASFAVGNLAMAPYFVLGPLVAKTELGGVRDWALMMTGGAVGGVVGGFVALRWKPARPLLVSFPLMLTLSLEMAALAVPLPLPVLVAGAALVVLSIVLGNVLWQTVEAQQIPNERLARVDALDWMVSLVFVPLGFVLAGPVSDRLGVRETLVLSAAVVAVSKLAPLLEPSVRGMRRLEPEVHVVLEQAPA